MFDINNLVFFLELDFLDPFLILMVMCSIVKVKRPIAASKK
jgi:hypothetical protein